MNESNVGVARRYKDIQQIYRLFNKSGELLYIGVSGSALARLAEHQQTKIWFDQVVTVTIEHKKCSRIEIEDAEEKAIEAENPKYNKMIKDPRTYRSIEQRVKDKQYARQVADEFYKSSYGLSLEQVERMPESELLRIAKERWTQMGEG